MRKFFTLLISAMVGVLAIAQSVEPARGAAQATLEPEELFMTATVGDTAIAYLTLTNTGTVTISPLWALTSDHGFLWCDGYNGDIPPAPGDNVRQIPVTYTPTEAGTHHAHLTMYVDGEYYYVDMTGEAVESTEPQVTATPVITVEEHTSEYDYYGSYVTLAATGDGDVRLYVNGIGVENPYDVYYSYEPQYMYVTATAQEEGKLISETAEMDYIVPAWPNDPNDPTMISPMPEVYVEQIDDYVVITAYGTGTVTMYINGLEVSNPCYIPYGDEYQYLEVMVVNEEDGMLPASCGMMVEVPASPSAEPTGNVTYAIINENEAVVTGRTPNTVDVVIPETVEIRGQQYTVTAIQDYAFYCDYDITSISIPRTVVTIGGDSFWATQNLTSITIDEDNPVFDSRDNCNAIIETATNTLIAGCQGTIIPETVTTIGEEAFGSQKNLTSIDIPNSVRSIKKRAFCYTGLVHVTIPGSVDTIAESAFYICKQLAELNLGEGVKIIGKSAFYECSQLSGVSIPSSVTSIGISAFACCSNISTMTVDVANTVYDSRNECNAIIETASNTLIAGCKTTLIPNNVITIGKNAFSGCRGLTEMDIPNSVQIIDSYAFSGCSGLLTLTIPNSVKEIKNSVFNSCIKLQSVVIPNSVTTIGIGAFSFCEKMTNLTICNGVETISSSAFSNCGSLTDVEIPNSVKSIGALTFTSCKELKHVSIPASLTSIGSDVFYNCPSLERIVVDDNNPVYDSRGNCNALILTSTNTLISGCRTTKIPEDILFIEEDAFSYAKVTSVKIPNSVKKIGNCAFEYCYDLTDVEIGGGMAYIGRDAFRRCTSLANVTCWAVNPPVIQKDNTFECFENYETAVLHVPHASLSAYQADDEWGKFAHITSFIGGGTGDLNGDGTLDVDDVTDLIGMMLNGEQLPAYADLNGDGVADIDDVTLLITMLLNGH